MADHAGHRLWTQRFNIRLFDFYTRAVPGAANRLIVRLCMQSDTEHCDAPGPAPDDLGGFVTTLLAINPDLTLAGYPDQWTEYTLTPADGLPVVGRGRIAFHYSVPLQLDGMHGTYIASMRSRCRALRRVRLRMCCWRMVRLSQSQSPQPRA